MISRVPACLRRQILQHLLPVEEKKMRPAAQLHAQQKSNRPPVSPRLLKPHQRQFQQQQGQGQGQQQSRPQEELQQIPEAPPVRQLTLQEKRETMLAAAGVRPKVSMKVSRITTCILSHLSIERDPRLSLSLLPFFRCYLGTP